MQWFNLTCCMCAGLAISLIAAAWAYAAPPERTLSFDPIELIAGREVAGKAELAVEHDGIEYRFVSADNKAAFEKEPRKYEVADGGACGRMGPLSGLGDASRFVVHESRIYFFASDACRSAFVKEPGKFLETPDARPIGTPEALVAGTAAMDRLVEWAGGADRIREMKSYTHSISSTQKSGDKDWKVTKSFAAVFPDRFVMKESWDDLWYSTIRSSDGAAMASRSSHEVIAASRREAFDRALARSLVVLIRAYVKPEPTSGTRPDTDAASVGVRSIVVLHDTKETIGTAEVDTIVVWMNGAASRISIDQTTGRPVQFAFRGRDGTSSVGDVVRTFTAYKSVQGVQLPTAYTVVFNGKDLPAAAFGIDSFEINSDVPAEWFDVVK